MRNAGILSLWGAGLPISEICLLAHVCRATIKSVLKEHGLKKPWELYNEANEQHQSEREKE